MRAICRFYQQKPCNYKLCYEDIKILFCLSSILSFIFQNRQTLTFGFYLYIWMHIILYAKYYTKDMAIGI
jgi:hypothetical protein